MLTILTENQTLVDPRDLGGLVEHLGSLAG
jgi:hypothetical protein